MRIEIERTSERPRAYSSDRGGRGLVQFTNVERLTIEVLPPTTSQLMQPAQRKAADEREVKQAIEIIDAFLDRTNSRFRFDAAIDLPIDPDDLDFDDPTDDES